MKKFANALLEGKLPPPPVAQLIGFNLVSAEYGKTIFEMYADKRHHNPMGTLHGGILCDIADAAMATAFGTTVDENESITTISFHIDFMKSLVEGKVIAKARVIKRGRTIGFMECDLYTEDNELIAKATSTCKVIKRKP